MTKDEILRLAQLLLAENGLDRWQVRWDGALRRAGSCRFAEKTITLSEKLLPAYSAETVREVILHEVAHALAGPKAGHGPAWQRQALQLGIRPAARLPAGLPAPEPQWVGTCPKCGARRELHRAPRRVTACGSCSRNFDLNLVFSWKYRGHPRIPPGAYRQELRRLERTRVPRLF